jgi:hypothetical protein
MGDAYPHRGAPGHVEARVPLPVSWVRREGGENLIRPYLIVWWRGDDLIHHHN